ncbi:TetR/AcrR family transcriptional regulator [Dokdonella immobilis]|uniref:Transcriptional regulator, TetR family n=1 Tax=Dokdonella immobilis TaxID=578942 RepID=A0A1I4YXP2_9GAMM|nr:TetR/AcrR family transcriptional regulator [Dokdonella immobilis]SFN42772.1 transcriptional regulator, TetR family [Dokdonella immobilis]
MGEAHEKSEPRGRLSATDWEQAALHVLAEGGVAAVAVESLARTLGVTKGSFYWHFPTREALLKAAIDRWEQRDEDEVISRVERIADPRERLRELFHRVSREVQSHLVYAALLQASDHPLVQPVIERISRRRLALLTQAYAEAGFDTRAAAHRARLAYTAYSGFLQLNQSHGMPRMDQEEYEAYVDHVIATLIPA